MTVRKILPQFMLVSMIFSACATATGAPASQPADTPTPAMTEAMTPAPIASPLGTETITPSNKVPVGDTPPPSAPPTITETMTPTPVPTYAILRGTINVERASCRYGPGVMYLYLYGLRQGANQDIIGRTDTGKWLLTRSRGDNKSCWVKADLFDINGDVMSVEMVYPDKYQIPESNQRYRPPWDVAAVRHGSQVVISWKSEALHPGDAESKDSVLYVVETWVCRDGQLIFTPLGAYVPQVAVTDEPGCAQPSHGRVFFSEKHGYAGPSKIPWPLTDSGSGAIATP